MADDQVQDPLIGRTLAGKFTVLARIAHGGMGAVYRGEQAALGRPCAIKVLKPKMDGDERFEFQRRFFLEASVAAKLTHPNTVTIFDYGKDEELGLYLAMELLEGRTLARAIRDEGPFPAERAVHITRQIARSLREAHAMAVVHRDVKPANVYLVTHADETDFVKVLDFGLVKDTTEQEEGEADGGLTQAGTFMGSPKYMSPEQIRGEKVDGRTDVYSLGIVLYEMLAGRPPFDKGQGVNTLLAHVNEIPPPIRELNPLSDAGDALLEIVARCIAKSPDDRFTGMEELLSTLRALEASPGALTATSTGVNAVGLPGGSGPHVFVSRGESGSGQPAQDIVVSMPPPPSSGKGKVIVFGVVVALAAAGAGFILKPRPPEKAPETAPAQQPTAAATPTTPATPSTATPAPTATEAKPIIIKVTSDPTGASVHMNDKDGREACVSTPCEISLAGGDARAGSITKLFFVKAGFVVQSKTFTVGDDPTVTVKLRAGGGGGGHVTPPPNADPNWKPVPYLGSLEISSRRVRGMTRG